jgi:hypothetical protein
MPPKASYSTPMLHAASLEASIAFYELLGFTTIATDGCTPLGWARLHCEGGGLMFLRAEPEHPVEPAKQGVMFAMYTSDLPGLRAHLLEHGLEVNAITYPGYMPSGQFNLSDPDGYHVDINQWDQAEQEAWEKRIAAKP